MRLLRARSAPLGFALLALTGGLPAPVRAQEKTYEQTLERCEELQHRLPFLMHARGWEELVRTGDPRARDFLIAAYDRPGDPEEFARHLLVALVSDRFKSQEDLDAFRRWRRRAHDAEDAWLWYRTLRPEAIYDGPAVHDLVLGKEDAYLRAAALEAMAVTRAPEALSVIGELLAATGAKDRDRPLLVESLMACLESRSKTLEDPDFQDAARKLIQLLDDPSLPDRTHLTMVRTLGRIFRSTSLVVQAEPWLRQLEAGRNPRPSSSSAPQYASFFGLEASGNRICYVIDLSDSMCKELDGLPPAAKGPKGPTTGGSSRRKKEEEKEKDLLSPDGLPWWKIRNRYDLAREQLLLSLTRLGESREFCIVWFGDEAGLLDSTPGMVPANSKNIQKVIKEFESIQPGPPTDMRPDGTLRGMTNLHGGMRRAFQVKDRGVAQGQEYVDRGAALEGADTIFVLTDGDPSCDDWPMKDTNYHEDQAGDPESHKKQDDAPLMIYTGPFKDWNRLLEDVERMNLFRKAEIHCVGIGEAQLPLLQRLAKLGNGKAQHVGNTGKR